jgi:hypothetical protein
MIDTYENLNGETMYKLTHEDGSVTCFTEQQYQDYLADKENGTIS